MSAKIIFPVSVSKNNELFNVFSNFATILSIPFLMDKVLTTLQYSHSSEDNVFYIKIIKDIYYQNNKNIYSLSYHF
jgi:hypothetical protein